MRTRIYWPPTIEDIFVDLNGLYVDTYVIPIVPKMSRDYYVASRLLTDHRVRSNLYFLEYVPAQELVPWKQKMLFLVASAWMHGEKISLVKTLHILSVVFNKNPRSLKNKFPTWQPITTIRFHGTTYTAKLMVRIPTNDHRVVTFLADELGHKALRSIIFSRHIKQYGPHNILDVAVQPLFNTQPIWKPPSPHKR